MPNTTLSVVRTLAPVFPPALSEQALQQALASPLGSPALSALAAGKQRVVCLIEDASRPAKTAAVVALVLEELAKCRPKPRPVELIFAHGAHLGLEEASRREKLPPGLTVPIHHHDARSTAIFLGRGCFGNPVYLNPIVAEADLRIGISTVNFHPAAGFSGGAKLIFPGVAGLESIMAHHALTPGGRGRAECPWRMGIESAASYAPLDFSLTMLARPDGKIAGLWAGAPAPCEKAAREALLRYARLPQPVPAGFCLVDMKPYDRSLLGFFKAVDLCLSLLAADGTGVITGACPEGVGRHLWRWHAETMRQTAMRLTPAFGGRSIYVRLLGVTADEIRAYLPAGVIPLGCEEELSRLAADAAGPKYKVPYGPMTAFADAGPGS